MKADLAPVHLQTVDGVEYVRVEGHNYRARLLDGREIYVGAPRTDARTLASSLKVGERITIERRTEDEVRIEVCDRKGLLEAWIGNDELAATDIDRVEDSLARALASVRVNSERGG